MDHRPSSESEIVAYLFDHDDLAGFMRKIAAQGKNLGAERPYVIKKDACYTVVEGNTRIASYKLLAGLLTAPERFASSVPHVSKSLRDILLKVDCSIAPSREALLPIMASAHFGVGDKSKWGYLGSRKALYDEWASGKKTSELAKVFDIPKSQVSDLIIEYVLYQKALSLKWTDAEKAILADPKVQFNPPVRFLQTSGHKAELGVTYDKANLAVTFEDAEAESKFRHLIAKLVINPEPGLGATASYKDVFNDYRKATPPEEGVPHESEEGGVPGPGEGMDSPEFGAEENPGGSEADEVAEPQPSPGRKSKSNTLFSYPVTLQNNLIIQLMKEAKDLDCRRFPASGAFLLRNIVEAILKEVIYQAGANPEQKSLNLESCLGLCQTLKAGLSVDDKRVLKEFDKHHVDYLNLGAHAQIIPNIDRLKVARDCIDQFVKRNV
jgi:hypothetical protein